MSEIHLSKEQIADLEREKQLKKQEVDRKLVEWMLEQRWMVIPVLRYNQRGITADLDLVEMTDENYKMIKSRHEGRSK